LHERVSARKRAYGCAELLKLMKVLQLTYRVPYPPTDGGAIGIYSITKGLVENGCEIDLVSINTPKHSQPTDAMKGLANQYDVFVNTNINPVKLLFNLLFKEIPYNVERFISEDVISVISNLLQKNTYDYIQVEGTFVAFYIEVIKKLTNCPVIIRAHNIEYVIWERLSYNEKNPLKKWFYKSLSKRLKIFEKKYYNKVDGIAAITEQDKQRLIEMGVDVPIAVVPVGMMLGKYDKEYDVAEKANTIFSLSALDWAPNIEGLHWFFDEVWEELHRQNPDIEFHIAGKSTPDWLMKLQKKNVFVHGFVDDAELFKKSYQLMLVPLLSGGGMRVKIIEGLAAQKCILSTSVGAEGVEYTNGTDMVIADDPKEWVRIIQHLLKNDTERKAIELKAVELAHLKYENKSVTKKYITFFQEISSKK